MPASEAASVANSLTFTDLQLAPPVLAALAEVGYESPTPIQAATIPPLLAGSDMLGQAQTGTGKTAAFALPVLSKIDLSRAETQALVLVPTRELAIQVAEAFQKYAAHMKGFHVLPIYGGQSYTPQLKGLKRGAHVVVGTPGRIMDHMKRNTLDLSTLKFLVLDEADEMLQMGFVDDIDFILEQTPPTRQVALFSATIPHQIRRIAQKHLRNPVEITIQSNASTSPNIRQRYWVVSGLHKLDALTRILEAETFDAMLIFVRTKLATVDLAERLEARGFSVAPLNGDIHQNQRERTIARLKNGELDIVVATDVAARGLDVERISHVFNYDIPYDSESYVHRIGRTGRAGRSGEAILFVAPRERNMLRIIERATRQRVEQMSLPSVADVNEYRITRFKQRITDALGTGDAADFRSLVEQIEREQGVPALEIAAALASMLQGTTPFLLEDRNGGRDQEGGRSSAWHGDGPDDSNDRRPPPRRQPEPPARRAEAPPAVVAKPSRDAADKSGVKAPEAKAFEAKPQKVKGSKAAGKPASVAAASSDDALSPEARAVKEQLVVGSDAPSDVKEADTNDAVIVADTRASVVDADGNVAVVADAQSASGSDAGEAPHTGDAADVDGNVAVAKSTDDAAGADDARSDVDTAADIDANAAVDGGANGDAVAAYAAGDEDDDADDSDNDADEDDDDDSDEDEDVDGDDADEDDSDEDDSDEDDEEDADEDADEESEAGALAADTNSVEETLSDGDDKPEGAGEQRPSRGKREQVYSETFRIEVGHVHGVKPGNIVGAIANESGLDGKHIGHIDIRDDHSFIDLPEGMPKEIFRELKTVRVMGQELNISRVLSKPEKSAGARFGDRPPGDVGGGVGGDEHSRGAGRDFGGGGRGGFNSRGGAPGDRGGDRGSRGPGGGRDFGARKSGFRDSSFRGGGGGGYTNSRRPDSRDGGGFDANGSVPRGPSESGGPPRDRSGPPGRGFGKPGFRDSGSRDFGSRDSGAAGGEGGNDRGPYGAPRPRGEGGTLSRDGGEGFRGRGPRDDRGGGAGEEHSGGAGRDFGGGGSGGFGSRGDASGGGRGGFSSRGGASGDRGPPRDGAPSSFGKRRSFGDAPAGGGDRPSRPPYGGGDRGAPRGDSRGPSSFGQRRSFDGPSRGGEGGTRSYGGGGEGASRPYGGDRGPPRDRNSGSSYGQDRGGGSRGSSYGQGRGGGDRSFGSSDRGGGDRGRSSGGGYGRSSGGPGGSRSGGGYGGGRSPGGFSGAPRGGRGPGDGRSGGGGRKRSG